MKKEQLNHVYDSTMRLLRRGASGNVKNLLEKLHPADLADIIGQSYPNIQDQIIQLFRSSDKLPAVFAELGSSFLEDYLERHKNYDFVVKILAELPSDDQADLVGEIPEEMSQELLKRMKKDESAEISGLLNYQEETAGGLMSTEVLKMDQEATVEEALKQLHTASEDVETIFYIYVVNEFGHLSGVLSIRQLFQVTPKTKLKDIMLVDVVKVNGHEPQEEVARLVAQYDLVAIPVVDDDDRLIGVITVDDVIDVIQEEANENMLRMVSAEVDSIEDFDFFYALKQRLPWFFILFLGGILTCEVIVRLYEKLPAVSVFAGFIPLLLRFGGIIARQSSTIMIQGMASGSLRGTTIRKVLIQQASLVGVVASLSAILVFLYTYFRFDDYGISLSFAVSASLFCSMLVALVLGIFIPMGFMKLKLDPAWATGSTINFMLDVLGLIIYFSFLLWVLEGRLIGAVLF